MRVARGIWTDLLDIKLEFDDVAVLHDVGFAFGTEEAGLFYGEFGTEAFQVVIFADIGGDETSLKICMNGAGGFWSSRAFFDGPGAAFFFASSEEGLKAEGIIGGFDKFA